MLNRLPTPRGEEGGAPGLDSLGFVRADLDLDARVAPVVEPLGLDARDLLVVDPADAVDRVQDALEGVVEVPLLPGTVDANGDRHVAFEAGDAGEAGGDRGGGLEPASVAR